MLNIDAAATMQQRKLDTTPDSMLETQLTDQLNKHKSSGRSTSSNFFARCLIIIVKNSS